MPDIVDIETRSRMMSGIRGKNTKPELLVRKGLHALGFRYRLHVGDLPGRPDLILPQYRAAVFVNGCFWHGHDCSFFKIPTTRQQFWREKIDRNRKRDRSVRCQLQKKGWRCLTVWECALRGQGRIGLEEALASAEAWIRSDVPESEIRGAA